VGAGQVGKFIECSRQRNDDRMTFRPRIGQGKSFEVNQHLYAFSDRLKGAPTIGQFAK
jgi:hypothetical protein